MPRVAQTACYRPDGRRPLAAAGRRSRGGAPVGDEICRFAYLVLPIVCAVANHGRSRVFRGDRDRPHDRTIVQQHHRGARRKSRRISAPSAARTRTGRRGGRARLSGPRPEYVVGHKLAALPRLCTRASRHVHHLLFFCARTAFGSGCRPIHHPSKGRVQSVESPNLANSPRRHDRGSLD